MVRKLAKGSGKAAVTKQSKMMSPADAIELKSGRERKRTRPHDDGRSLTDRIQAEREQLFKAIALVECCKYASATLLDVEAPDYVVGVYDFLIDVLDVSAGELGCIVDSCRSGA